MDGQEARVRRRLDPVPDSAGVARRLVRDVLVQADRVDLADAAELIASELVTNALLHTATPVEISASLDGDGLLLEVADGSSTMPVERDYAALAGTGRGLALVHELTTDWGVRPIPDGKVVWARVTDAAPARQNAPSLSSESAMPAGRVVPVVLRNVPLLMHLAWHEHAETLLREYLLARLEDDEATALAEHAVVSSAMALLRDQVPAPDLPGGEHSLDVVELLISVIEPVATLEEGWLHVPTDTVPNFKTLNQVMDAAIDMAEADELLAAPMQPELRELRRWLCDQVEWQSGGGDPAPWSPPPILPAPGTGVRATDWDRVPVDRSTKALVAADDTNRIIAVSAPALELLGYDDADQLVGERLLKLIPFRFHQGHLAGFTLHLTQGRAPLIDAAAVVPFVRADGTEIHLELLIEALSVADGRRVFVATLGEPGVRQQI